MIQIGWGLLGPENLASERRVRTLGVGAAVRKFNDLAVPGMGNVFFGKQLLLATIGVAVAERLRKSGMRAQNIETANAIEALACWLTFQNNNWASDPRLRGVTKMRHRSQAPPFAEARKRSFYVTQPMRMSTVQPLPALRFVISESERFNAFSIGQFGRHFIDSVCEHYGASYHTKDAFEHLVNWALGNNGGLRSEGLRAAISPVEPLPRKTREFLRECLVRGDDRMARRRMAIRKWVERLLSAGSKDESWSSKPPELDEEHWIDLQAGAKFFATRETAIGLLDEIECHIGSMDHPRLDLRSSPPSHLRDYCERLRQVADDFLAMAHDPSSDHQAADFCRECLDEGSVIENLVKRDGQVLRLGSNAVVPGPAFRPSVATTDTAKAQPEDDVPADHPLEDGALPRDISRRVGNMLLLSRDLRGELSEYLTK